MRFICENCGKETREGLRTLDLKGDSIMNGCSSHKFLLCSGKCQEEFQAKLIEAAVSLTDSVVK